MDIHISLEIVVSVGIVVVLYNLIEAVRTHYDTTRK